MYDFDIDHLDQKLTEQKQLLVNVSRGLDKLAGKRKGVEDTPRSAARDLIAAVAVQVRAYASSALSRDQWRSISVKAVVNPASTTNPGYAQELSQPASVGIFDLLTPLSAYTQLAKRGMKVSLDGHASIKLPMRASSGDLAAAWLAEGAAIPVKGSGLSNTTLALSKVGVIAFFSEELSERSLPTIESVLRAILAEDVGTVLDAALLSNSAATAVKPAGLLFGVTPLTPTAGGGVGACSADIGALLTAISPAADPVLVMGESERARLLGLCPGYASLPILATSALAAKTVVALDAGMLVTAEGDNPTIAVAKDAVLHADSSPTAIGIAGSPNVIAAPTYSMFQSDLLAIRLIQFAGWTLRSSGSVSVVNSVTW